MGNLSNYTTNYPALPNFLKLAMGHPILKVIVMTDFGFRGSHEEARYCSIVRISVVGCRQLKSRQT